MLAHRLTIENQDYVLDTGSDIGALQTEICDAMRNGGGIVSFTTSTHRSLTAIVSPGVPVMFESFALPDDDASQDNQDEAELLSYLDDC